MNALRRFLCWIGIHDWTGLHIAWKGDTGYRWCRRCCQREYYDLRMNEGEEM